MECLTCSIRNPLDAATCQRCGKGLARNRRLKIGRDPENDIVIDHSQVSWVHAILTRAENGDFIADCKSTNGTYLNHHRRPVLQETRIAETDLMVFFGLHPMELGKLLGPVVGKSPVNPGGNRMGKIGRDPACPYPIDDPKVSWHHAELRRGNSGIEVRDLASLNGTYVNNERVREPQILRPGDRLVVGSTLIVLDLGGRLKETQVREVGLRIDAEEAGLGRHLAPVSLSVAPGKLVAIMGPSGAGKTTLLKILNGYTRPAEGRVSVDGRDLYRHYDLYRKQIGYVPQEDIMHPQLTVREVLYYTARLRTDLKKPEILGRIDQMLVRLGIQDRGDTIIGSTERQVISGGERKRVNIAMELMSDPSLLFLDEPTSGLSSEDAENVMQLLWELAECGRTVLVTIHQPSLAVFKQFHQLAVVARDSGAPGRLVYFGPAHPDSLEFFNNAGCDERRQKKEEPGPELLFRKIGIKKDGSGRSAADWAEHFRRSRQAAAGNATRTGAEPGSGKVEAPVRKKGLGQILPLSRRALTIRLRDRTQSLILLAQAPIFAVLLVLVYQGMADSGGRFTMESWRLLVGKIAGTHFMMAIAAVWFGCNNACREIVGEQAIYARERKVSLQIPSYIVSKFVVMGALCAVQCSILVGLVAAFTTIREPLLPLLVSLFLASMNGVAVGLFVSAVVKTTEAAVACLPLILLPLILLSGGMKPLHEVDEGIRKASLVMPTRWAFESNLKIEAEHRVARFQPPTLPGAAPAKEQDVASNHFPDENERADFPRSCAFLIGLSLCWTALLGAALKRRDYR